MLRLLRERSTDTAEVTVAPCECQLVLGAGEALNLTIYLDNSVVEVYANERVTMTSRIYPSRAEAQRLSLDCTAAVRLRRMWQSGQWLAFGGTQDKLSPVDNTQVDNTQKERMKR